MSGSVAEALLATGSKKLTLLPPPPKLKKEPKTFQFELKLPESNDESYPEFSWTELVRNSKQNEVAKRVEKAKGTPVLDPYASDDEDDLKAMAAKFEAKYNNPSPMKKKKKRMEDFIDKGAGYDETDPFIDNSDVYDEVVPPDLQTKHGGFYINSGSLDFKEVQLSEDEDNSVSQPLKVAKVDKPKEQTHSAFQTNSTIQKIKRKVGRPPGSGVLNKTPPVKDKMKLLKKRKLIVTPVGPDGKTISSDSLQAKVKNPNPNQESVKIRTENNISKPGKTSLRIVSSSESSSSGSSSSDDSSSSSESESSSMEEIPNRKEKPKEVKNSVSLKVKAKSVAPNPVPKPLPTMNANAPSSVHPPPAKRLKTKNVPLNPKLHPNLTAASMPSPSSLLSSSNVQQQQLKDLMKASSNGGMNLNSSPRVQSPLGAPAVTSSPASIRVPTPKSIPSPSGSGSISSGLIISPVTTTPHLPKPSNAGSTLLNKQQKAKVKQPSNTQPQITHSDIFQALGMANYSTLSSIPSLSFSPAITSTPSNLKSGMNLSMNAQKSLPTLKKLPQSSDNITKPLQKVLKKPKPPSANLSQTPPPAHSISSSSGATNVGHSFLTGLANSYKTPPPPPLAGPGVDASTKYRTPPNSLSTTKSSSTHRSVTSNSHAANAASLALTSVANQIINNAFASSGYGAVISTSANALLANSIPSSLSVQRLSQVTITPTPHSPYSSGSTDRLSLNNSKGSSPAQYSVGVTDIKPIRHNSAYDVSSLLQNTVSSDMNLSGPSVITMANSKLGPTGKIINRNLPPKKQ